LKKKVHERSLSPQMKINIDDITEGDEFFRNGIFVFNISKLIGYIEGHKEEFELVEILVDEYFDPDLLDELKDEYIDSADINRPVILAEIAPDRLENGYPDMGNNYRNRGYNLVDGHHRLAKAYKTGVKKLECFLVRMEKHIPFMVEGFESYVEYWNGKF